MSVNGFDLSSFDAVVEAQERGIDVEIKGPDGKKLGPDGFAIKIAGPDSARVKAAYQRFQDERLADEDIAPVTAKDIEERGLRILALATISWTPIKLDGGDYQCNEENAYKLYKRFAFIGEQVEKKSGRSVFMKGSAKLSAGQSENEAQVSGSASP